MDPRTGLIVRRSFRIPAKGMTFEQTTTFENATASPVRWSIWEVCQLPVGSPNGPDRNIIDVASASPHRHIDFGSYVGEVTPFQVGDDTVRVPVEEVVAKRGFPSATGIVTHISATGSSLTISSPVVVGATYPDGGCPVEVWMQFPVDSEIEALADFMPRDRYAEIEVLSPLYDLPPGAAASIDLAWTLSRAPSAPASSS
jgi:hypothetical protein